MLTELLPHLVGVEQGGLVEHALHVTTAANALIYGHFAKALVTVLGLKLLELSLLHRQLLLENLLQRLYIEVALFF